MLNQRDPSRLVNTSRKHAKTKDLWTERIRTAKAYGPGKMKLYGPTRLRIWFAKILNSILLGKGAKSSIVRFLKVNGPRIDLL